MLQLLKLPDGTVKVLVEGTQRARLLGYTDNPDYFEASVELVDEEVGAEEEVEALARSVVGQFESYVKLNKKISPEVLGTLGQIDDHSKLADTIASHLAIKISDKQELLETTVISERLEPCIWADGERNLSAAGGKEDPQQSQTPDGEDAARVLSE